MKGKIYSNINLSPSFLLITTNFTGIYLKIAFNFTLLISIPMIS